MNNITPAELVRYFTGSDENDSEEDEEEAYVQKLRSSYESDRWVIHSNRNEKKKCTIMFNCNDKV